MLQQSTYIQIDLDSGEAVSLLRAENCLLLCVSGTLWLTEDNGGGDVVLEAGDCYRLTRRGRTVIQSVGQRQGARCRLRLATSSPRLFEALRGWVSARLAGWPVLSRGAPAGISTWPCP